MNDPISDQLLINQIVAEPNSHRHQHIHQLVSQYEKADDIEKPQLREVYAKVLAQAFAAKDEISMSELREFEPLASIAIDAPMMAHAEAIASSSIGQRMVEQRIQELKDTPAKAIPLLEAAIHFAVDTAEAYEHPLSHLKNTANSVITLPVNTAKAIGHVGFVYTDKDRQDMAEVFSQPYEQRMKAYYAEKWDDVSDIAKSLILVGSAYKLKATLPEAEANLPMLPSNNPITNKTKELISTTKEKLNDFFPQFQTNNGLVTAGIGTMADGGEPIPTTTIMHMASSGGDLGKQKINNTITHIDEARANRNLKLGQEEWREVQHDISHYYGEIKLGKQFLEDIKKMNDNQIELQLYKKGYLDFEFKTINIYPNNPINRMTADEIDAAHSSAPTRAVNHIHSVIKDEQRYISYHMREAAQITLPDASNYTMANNLPLPDANSHPYAYQAANKLYTEMANTLFKLEMDIEKHDSVARIPLTQLLPNDPASTAIFIVDKVATNTQELYLATNELAIAGNFNNSPAPILKSSFSRVSDAQVTKLIGDEIRNAADADNLNKNTPDYEQELPKILKIAEQYISVVKNNAEASTSDDKHPER